MRFPQQPQGQSPRQRRMSPKDPRAKKMMEQALTGKSVTKLDRSRLLQIMAMNAAKKGSFSGGSQHG